MKILFLKRTSIAVGFSSFALVAGLCFSQIQSPPRSATAPAVDTFPTRSDYRISAGDVLEFKFFYNPELNESIQVRPDGKVSLSLIGDISAENRTIADLKTEVETRYGATLNRPSANIIVRAFGSQKVYIGGEVNRPMSIPLISDLTAQQAVLEAGGAKRTADLAKAVLIRRGRAGVPLVQSVDLKVKSINGILSMGTPVLLQPFDVILLPERRIARVDRWVDEYLRQSIPVTLTGGFSYLFNPLQVGQ